jgi:hypothetical protein
MEILINKKLITQCKCSEKCSRKCPCLKIPPKRASKDRRVS